MSFTVKIESIKDAFEVVLSGIVPKEGQIEYSAAGMVGHYHNVVHYLRACAAEGKTTTVQAVHKPLDAFALHKLLSLTGTRVSKVTLFARRYTTLHDPNIGTVYAFLDLKDVKIVSVRQVTGDSGRTFFLAQFQSTPGSGTVSMGVT